MPSAPQTIVSPAPTTKIMDLVSRADSALLESIYPGSPIIGTNKSVTDASQKAKMQAVLNEDITENVSFGTFNPNFADAPDLSLVETGNGGLPATPYVPNPTSPGEGSINPVDQAEAPDGYMPVDQASGMGSIENPSVTSTRIAGATLGAYIKGSSTPVA